MENRKLCVTREDLTEIIIPLLRLAVSIAGIVLAIIFATTIIVTDDATSLLLKGEKEFKRNHYQRAYEYFSSTLLYDNPMSKAYLGYMNSNGIGCEQDILLGTMQYQEAVDMGLYIYKANILYNIVNYSCCYYEIADALLESYDENAIDSTFFIASCIVGPLYHSKEGAFSLSDYNNANAAIAAFLDEHDGERTDALAVVLSKCVDNYAETEHTINIAYPNNYHEFCSKHEICSSEPLANWTHCMTAFVSGHYAIYGTVSRYAFTNQDIIQQITPNVVQ